MRKKGPPRVLGPYPERKRWRLIIFEGGTRKAMYLASQEEALRLKSELSAQLKQSGEGRRLSTLVDAWTDERLRVGTCKPETAREQDVRLRAFLGDHLEKDVSALSAKVAAAVYQQAVEAPSPKTGAQLRAATHRFYLKLAQSFFDWAVEEEHVRSNPFADVKPVGKVNAGKPQLRLDEARRFIDVGLRLFDDSKQPLAVGAVMALMMGLRTGEVIDREVRDVEDGARFLCIAHGKTHNAARRPEVPLVLRPYLMAMLAGKSPNEPLFGMGSTGKPLKRQALHGMVRRICKLANVPVVCTHSLRGLFATLGVQSGAVTHAVAATLGHGTFAVTQKHYAQPDAVTNAQTARVSALLAGEPQLVAAPNAVSGMSAEQLLALLDEGTRAKLAALLNASSSAAENAGAPLRTARRG